MSPEARVIFEQIQTYTAGHKVSDVWEALASVLANVVGYAADNKEHSSQLLILVCHDMGTIIDENWDEIRAVRLHGTNQPVGRA